LTVLKIGIDSTTNPELAQLILKFKGSEKTVRQNILNNLMLEGKVPLVFQLLEQVDSDVDQAWLYRMVVRLNDKTMELGREDRWADIDFIYRHPLTFKHEPRSSIQFQMALGSLEKVIEDLKEKIATAEKDGKEIDEDNLTRLLSIFRMERRFDEADEFVKKIKKGDFKNAMANQLLFEKGDWQGIAKKMATEEQVPNAENGLIAVTESQRAFVYKLIGDEEGYRGVIKKFEEKIEKAIEEKNEEEERSLRDAIIEIALVNLDWDAAAPHFDRENSTATFRTLMGYRRYEEAFKVIGLGETAESRDLWFTRKMRYLKTLADKVKRLDKANKDTDVTQQKQTAQWNLCLGQNRSGAVAGVAEILGSLGLVDEAVAHYHTMFSNYKGLSRSRREYIVWQLVWLGRYAEARKLVKDGFTATEQARITNSLFPFQKDRAASFWVGLLAKRYPDPFKRLMIAAGMVNSPLCVDEDFDLEFEIASAQPNQTTIDNGYWDYMVGGVYQFHGNESAFKDRMQISRQRGYSLAKKYLIQDFLEAGDVDTIIEYYGPMSTAFSALMTADAFRQKGNVDTAAIRRALAFAHWQDNYSNTSTISSLEVFEKQHLASDFLKLQVFEFNSSSDKSVSQERYRSHLAKSQLESDPHVAVINSQINLFHHFNDDKPGEQNGTYWVDLMISTRVAMARSAIAKGELKKAADLLIECDKFAPGDPELGEKLIAELDKAGGTKEADRLFAQLSEFYIDILAKYPESAQHHNNYAWLCVSANRRTEYMQRHAELAVKLQPDNSSYLDTLAAICFSKGDKERAIRLCRQCIQIDPTKSHYRDQLKKFLASQ